MVDDSSKLKETKEKEGLIESYLALSPNDTKEKKDSKQWKAQHGKLRDYLWYLWQHFLFFKRYTWTPADRKKTEKSKNRTEAVPVNRGGV